jgi:integrase
MAKNKTKYPVKGLDRHGQKWRWRRTIDGESVRVIFEAKTQQAAVAQVLEFEKHPHLLIAATWEREVEMHLQVLVQHKKITKTYADNRKMILTMAGREIGIEHPRQLNGDNIKQWLDEVSERTNDNTRNSYLSHINQFCLWLEENKKIYLTPCAGLHRTKTDFTPRLNFLTTQQVRDVIDAAKASNDKELELILLLACECGMRKGEITAARPEWVNLQQGTITVPAVEKDDSWSRKGMMGRKRSVTIEMVSELRTFFHENGISSPYLLRPNQPWGKWKYRYDFDRKVRTFLKDCGHPEITVHDLRRSFGSNRVIAGRTIEQVANWMGIHPSTAWKYYARFTPVTGDIEHGSAASAIPAPPPKKKKSKKKKKKTTKKTDPIKQLKLLKTMLANGLITEDQYNTKQTKIVEEL